MSPNDPIPMKSEFHDCPVVIARNNFKFKSLSCWSVNAFLGCSHGCIVCYVPDTSTNKQKNLLAAYDTHDPVGDWGNYVLVRPWDEQVFITSLIDAQMIPPDELNKDGNRAVMFSSTTDPYQVVRNPVASKRDVLNSTARSNMRRSLEMILNYSNLNVRILTRSSLARQDFDLFKKFGNRLLLGVSLPTLDDNISQLFEPHAPGPMQRLKLLVDAHKEGIPTFVAIAPVYPGCDYQDMLKVFNSVKEANPVTYFMEPMNIRLGVAERIEKEALKVGREIDMSPYQNEGSAWSEYAVKALLDAERAADAAGVRDRLHLWPDHDSLGAAKVVKAQSKDWSHPSGMSYLEWLESCWNRISEWPGKPLIDADGGS